MHLNRENSAAVEEAAAVLGMTPDFYLNEVVGRAVGEAMVCDKASFLAGEAQYYSYGTDAAAECVADRINEISVVDHLNGAGSIFSADVTRRENGRFQVQVDVLFDGEWNRLQRPTED
ncbi:MAG TPA: hypothetical protein VGD78_19425 [Chthoniobacterales bacterium]